MCFHLQHRHAQQLVPSAPNELSVVSGGSTADTVKFEEKRMMSASKTKVIKDGYSSEQVRIAQIKRRNRVRKMLQFVH